MRLNESLFNRRDFLDGLLGAGVVACGAVAGEAILGYLTGLKIPEPDEITVNGEHLELLEKDRFILLPYGPQPVMLIKLPDGNLRAFTAVCTHGQCNVRYRPDENDIYCGCHKGRFDAEGVNVPGTPPPRPLRKFYIQKENDGTLLVSNKPFDETAQPEDDNQGTAPAKG
ncbi:MAG: QcrA and Rieske domain-containing protein [Planctomycetota bacterium]|jgi:Rieske Fe-S protein